MVQSSKNISDFKMKIWNDPIMSIQCKKSLMDDEKIEDIFKFKNKPNPSLHDIYNLCGNLYEIGFFENIDFHNMLYKIMKNIGLNNLVKNC